MWIYIIEYIKTWLRKLINPKPLTLPLPDKVYFDIHNIESVKHLLEKFKKEASDPKNPEIFIAALLMLGLDKLKFRDKKGNYKFEDLSSLITKEIGPYNLTKIHLRVKHNSPLGDEEDPYRRLPYIIQHDLVKEAKELIKNYEIYPKTR